MLMNRLSLFDVYPVFFGLSSCGGGLSKRAVPGDFRGGRWGANRCINCELHP